MMLLIVLVGCSFCAGGLCALMFGLPKGFLAMVVLDVAGIALAVMAYNRGKQDALMLLAYSGGIVLAIGVLGALMGAAMRKRL